MKEIRPVVITVGNRFVRSDGSQVVLKDSSEVHEVKEFSTTPATVRRVFGVTLNQGNYESTRVDVGVEVPCYLEDVELADEWARAFCEKRLKEEALALKSDRKKNPI